MIKNKVMEAKDLMIGDWLFDGHVYAQVTSITCDGNIETTHNEHSNIELIEPIPLTPEILEKNGWVKDLYSVESYDNEELECLSLWVGEDGKNKWWWHVGVDLVTPINYVHQLQHAMRLCGIEKEIKP